MAGIYIHIPFCKKACTYCNFHFSTNLKLKDSLIDCLVKELILQKNYLNSEQIETVYFGGGTPSLLSGSEINILLQTITENFPSDLKEVTLEANPDDLSFEKLDEFKSVGITRFSLGVQSFFNHHLIWMNRTHSAEDAKACIENIRKVGFESLSIDLIYGLPIMSNEEWEENIFTAIQFNIPHLSCYALTVEKKTALSSLIDKKKYSLPDEVLTLNQFTMLVAHTSAHHYEHYEISNFAKENYYALHNSNYWNGKKYLGIGPSAHSFNGVSRRWNISNNALYCKSLEKNIIPYEEEILTQTQQANEMIMLSLRTKWGLNLERFENKFGAEKLSLLQQEIKKEKIKDTIEITDTILKIKPENKFLSDGIISNLFLME